MAAHDHSLTYKENKLKNIPHKLRLRKIIRVLTSLNTSFKNFIDVGCSNGYITNIIRSKFEFETVTGVDYSEENLEKAKIKYPEIVFEPIDLNEPISESLIAKYELVTCFETLEHVGNLKTAVSNILSMSTPKGTVVITVPIEIGFWGIGKFILKRFVYGYTLKELKGVSTSQYFSSLIKGNNMGQYRDMRKEKRSWGTHFGFDYRNIDKILKKKGIPYKAKNSNGTRVYIINNISEV